ncbi:MAG TPA: tetratricopeptide repeat protein [Planktothrix sp.]
MSRAASTFCIRLSLVTAVIGILFPPMVPTWAQDGGMAADISHCESVLKGQSMPEGPAEERVSNLERGIFGKTSKGPLDKRLQKIHEALGIKGSKFAAPDYGVKPSVASEAPQSTVAPPGASTNSTPAPELQATASAPVAPPATASNSTAPNGMTTKQLLQLGAQKFAKGDTVQAESLFQQVLMRDPNNVDAYFNLGALAERRGDLSGALDQYKKAQTLNPSDNEITQAVVSVQDQLVKKPVRVTGKGPLIGNAMVNTDNTPPLVGATPRFGTPILPSVPPPPAIGTVGTPYPPVVGITPRGKGFIKGVIGAGLNAGLMAAPGLHCPICRLMGGF